jgi:hypothetical protein
VRATTFCELRGDGKDFENVWVLLLQTHLLLQHRVRLGSDSDKFWPQSSDGVRIGGRRSSTGDSLQMFACGIARESALFKEPDKGRVYEAPGSTIRREIHFDVTEPSLVMLWQNLWVADLRVGGGADVSALVVVRGRVGVAGARLVHSDELRRDRFHAAGGRDGWQRRD